jgi:hypothetical protein
VGVGNSCVYDDIAAAVLMLVSNGCVYDDIAAAVLMLVSNGCGMYTLLGRTEGNYVQVQAC